MRERERERERRDINSLAIEVLATFWIYTLGWKRKSKFIVQSNARLGLVTVEDGILESHGKMMAFRTIKNKFHIPRGYGYI